MKFLLIFLFVVGSQLAEAQVMKYVSSHITKQNSRLYRLQVITSGASNPLSVTRLSAKAKVFYTGSDSTFSQSRLFPGEQTLNAGVNYFWLVSDKAVKNVSFDLGRQEYSQVWTDEFNGNSIDTSNWKFEKGFVRNHELQWYQQENAYCSDGMLIIEARREKKPNPNYVAGSTDWRRNRQQVEYTSSSMLTAGKQSWLYGRFEMRARIDTAAGYWPAWWTLGISKRWPANGEIDIMEFYRGKILANYAVVSSRPGTAYWFSNTKEVRSFAEPGWKNNFHVWKMDWDENGISIYVDDLLLNYQPQDSLYNRDGSGFFPFKQQHYMLLNLAIGGDNGGDPAQTVFPCKYEVDYVRVSQKIKGRFTRVGTYKPL